MTSNKLYYGIKVERYLKTAQNSMEYSAFFTEWYSDADLRNLKKDKTTRTILRFYFPQRRSQI